MNWVDLEYFDMFYEESCDNLIFLEELISNISNEITQEDLDHLFRVFHSLKGLAGMMGFMDLSDANHLIETHLKLYQRGNKKEDCFKKWLLSSRDLLQDMVTCIYDAVQVESEIPPELVDYLKQITINTEDVFELNKINENSNLNIDEDFESFIEQFNEFSDPLLQFVKDQNFDEVALILHTLKGDAGTCDLVDLVNFFHRLEDLLENDVVMFFESFSDVHDVILSYLDSKDRKLLNDFDHILFNKINNSKLQINNDFIVLLKKFVNELSKSLKQDDTTDDLKLIVQEILKSKALKECGDLEIHFMTVEMGGWENLKINPYVKELLSHVKSLISSQVNKEVNVVENNEVKPKHQSQKKETFKVETKYINHLMDLSGEFIVAKNILVHNLKQLRENSNDLKELNQVAATINRLCDSLQYNVMKMRLIPCKEVFRKAPKIVRDISKKLNKKIELEVIGDDTEIDKFMSDKISDALLHIIRNSCDHGIEIPECRVKNNKSEIGKIIIKACHDKAFLKIEIIDDGAGVNTEKVLNKIISLGIVSDTEGKKLTENQIAKYIFHPGLSTADKISDISGRGVGMDVVKTNIESLGGKVEVFSKVGEGTRFEIFLPLNTSVKKCLITEFSGDFNAFSIDQISETIKIKNNQVVERLGRYYFFYRNHIVEIPNLKRNRKNHKLILTIADGKILGLEVDKFLGWEDLVIKQSPPLLKNISGVIGVSVLGDGSAILVNDVLQVVKYNMNEVDYAA